MAKTTNETSIVVGMKRATLCTTYPVILAPKGCLYLREPSATNPRREREVLLHPLQRFGP